MVTLQTLMNRREEIFRLAEQYHVEHLRVFGSVARQRNTAASDVDLLFKPAPGCSLFDLGGLVEDLQELLGCPVDLVTEDGLKPRARDQILSEAIVL